MTGSPRLSVCIRAYGRRASLRRAIESVLAQGMADMEVVVVDDASGAPAVVAGIGDPRVRCEVNTPPLGSVESLRRAVALSRGELIAVLDDDDYWLPGFLDAVLAVFDRDPGAGVVFTADHLEAGGRRVVRDRALAPGRHTRMAWPLLDRSIPPCAAVMRRAVWEQGEAEYPLEATGIADMTMWLRAAATGWPFVYLPEPLSVYSLHPEQMSWGPTIPSRLVATLERFRFDDDRAERRRWARLREARAAQAGLALRRGHLRAAGSAARAAGPRMLGVRGIVAASGARTAAARWLARHPSTLERGFALWRRARPRVPG